MSYIDVVLCGLCRGRPEGAVVGGVDVLRVVVDVVGGVGVRTGAAPALTLGRFSGNVRQRDANAA